MRRRLSIFTVAVLALGGFLGLAAVPPSLAAEGIAVERLGAGSLTIEPQAAFERAVLKVSGPGGFAFRESFEAGEPITVDLFPGSSPAAETRGEKNTSAADARGAGGAEPIDGRYKYEVIFAEAGGGRQVFQGLFFVDGGVVMGRSAKRAELASVRDKLAVSREELESRPPGPTVYVASDRIGIVDGTNDGTTEFNMDSDYPVNDQYWIVHNNMGDLEIVENSSYTPGGGYVRGFFERGSGDIGFGTTAPFGSLDIVDSDTFSQITMATDGGVGYQSSLQLIYGLFSIEGQYEQDIFNVNVYAPGNSVNIDYYGQVGFGTSSPGADAEIYDFASYAALRLNNGTASWAFSNTPSGVFTVNKVGSGGQEFTVLPRLDAAGNTMQVQGSVQGTKFVASSSRDLKTDFTALDGKEVLARLTEVPLMSWRYKTDDEADRHFGPVAEDFQAAFQLGDGKTIANIDADGVALAAIQGLHSMLQDKDKEIADLTKRLAALEELLQAHPPGGS